MNVAVAGLNHVGTVTSANVSPNGHDAWGVDVGDAAGADGTWAVARWLRRVSLRGRLMFSISALEVI